MSARSRVSACATTPGMSSRYETRRVIYDGATEVDMVINVGALKAGDLAFVECDIAVVVSACKDCGVLSKVIIEAGAVDGRGESVGVRAVQGGGRDYVKTSTGFGLAVQRLRTWS